MGMNNFEELNIWKRSIELVKEIYHLTNKFPKSEKFSLVDQIRRSANSIPSNIAEGCGRNTEPQVAHFINISIGSLCELQTQIVISVGLNFITKEESKNILTEVSELKKMTWSFLRSQNKKSK